jgi:hypothetical protein
MRASDHAQAIEVMVNGENWTEVPSLSGAGPNDKVFSLNPESGVVVFGDGVYGQVPPDGAQIIASYREGAGTAGNIVISVTIQWPPKISDYRITVHPNGFSIRSAEGIELPSGTKRNRYFFGRILTSKDFEDEQQYHLDQRCRHNRNLHGYGIVTGLDVSISPCESSPSVVVSPGYALDPYGREILVTENVALPIGCRHSPLFVTIAHKERETDWVPGSGADEKIPSRIEDYVLAALVADPDNREAVTIGRVLSDSSGWSVDRTFQPPRAR